MCAISFSTEVLQTVSVTVLFLTFPCTLTKTPVSSSALSPSCPTLFSYLPNKFRIPVLEKEVAPFQPRFSRNTWLSWKYKIAPVLCSVEQSLGFWKRPKIHQIYRRFLNRPLSIRWLRLDLGGRPFKRLPFLCKCKLIGRPARLIINVKVLHFWRFHCGFEQTFCYLLISCNFWALETFLGMRKKCNFYLKTCPKMVLKPTLSSQTLFLRILADFVPMPIANFCWEPCSSTGVGP